MRFARSEQGKIIILPRKPGQVAAEAAGSAVRKVSWGVYLEFKPQLACSSQSSAGEEKQEEGTEKQLLSVRVSCK